MVRMLFAGTAVVLLGACGNSPTSPVPRAAAGTAPPVASQAASRPVELRGQATKLAGACPTLTFAVSGRLVTTTANTTFLGDGCAMMADDTFVVVTGIPASDGSVVASSVRVPSAPAPVTHVHGTVASLGGTCPSITFSVGQTNVSTTGDTTFVGGACTSMVDGTVVDVDGTAAANNTLGASRVLILR